MGCRFLFQGIFPPQGSNLSLPHWQSGSLPTEPPEKPGTQDGLCKEWSAPNVSNAERGTPCSGVSRNAFFSSVQLLSRVWLFATPWTAERQASLSITNSQSLLKLMCIESVMPSNHFILCHPLLLPPSIFPSIRVFSNESVLRIRWPQYWSFSFSISPSSESSELISFRIDCFDFLLVQGAVRSLLQHHNLKAPLQDILWENI